MNHYDSFFENNGSLYNDKLFLNEESLFNNNYSINIDNSLNFCDNDPIFNLNEERSNNNTVNLEELNEYKNSIDNNNSIYFIKKSNLNKVVIPNEEKKDINFKIEKEKFVKNNSKKSTSDNSLSDKVILKDNSNIIKNEKNKNLGRKRKGEIYNENEVHNKERPDNIRIKFKRLFFKNLILFINFLLDKSTNFKLKGKKFQKIDSAYINNMKKDKNLKMLDLPAVQILSKDICKKYKRYEKDNNRKIIKIIYEENEISLIEVLNKKIRELMITFCSDNVEEGIFENYKRLKNYVEELYINKNKEKESFIKKFIYEANNFEKELKKLDGRKENN